MSMFRVEAVKVKVEKHPNADKLDIIRFDKTSWQCVSLKDQFRDGDLAIYLPVDSVLPEELVKNLGIEKYYHTRLKTIKLRGCVSQGMVMAIPPGLGECKEGDDLTERLGVTKYDPPIPVRMAGIIAPEEPRFAKYTEIENLKNLPDLFEEGEILFVVEKIHGSNGRAMNLDGKLLVGSHNMNLKEQEGNLYWRTAKLLKLEETLKEGEEVFFEVYGNGVQDLAYGCKPGEIRAAMFDIMVDNAYLAYHDFIRVCSDRHWEMAPVLRTMPYKRGEGFEYYAMMQNSVIDKTQIMEGVVLRPVAERWAPSGRVILKSISDEYLVRHDATERH